MATMRMLALLWAVGLCALYVHAQQPSCSHDAQCDAGFFCESTLHTCHNCLNCEDLKREALVIGSPNSCIKSVLECGTCLQGLVVNYRRDVNGECVRPDQSVAESALPGYLWAVIGLVTLCVSFAVLIMIVYVLRKKDLFRVSTATWLRSSCTSGINASAPDPPPPYNPYSAVRPESPFALPDVAYSLTDEQEASNDPFIKRVPFSERRVTPARESDGSQNARVYDPPAYVRNVRIDPQTPIPELTKEESDNWPSIHNEDTTPHDWTPNTSTNDTNGNTSASEAAAKLEAIEGVATSSDLPALLAAARDSTLVVPPAKKQRKQDNNNNGNHGASSSSSGDDVGAGIDLSAPPAPHAPDAPAIYYNIVQINNTKF